MLLIQSSFSLTQDLNMYSCTDVQIKTFNRLLDLTYSQAKHDCHFEVKEKLVQMSDNTISRTTVHVKGPLVKYQCKFSQVD